MEKIKVKIFYEKIISCEEEVEIDKADFDIMNLKYYERTQEQNKLVFQAFDKYEQQFMYDEENTRFEIDNYKEDSFSIMGFTA